MDAFSNSKKPLVRRPIALNWRRTQVPGRPATAIWAKISAVNLHRPRAQILAARLLAVLAGTLVTGPAAAQTTLLQKQPTFDTSGTAYQVQVSRPTQNDDGVELNCSYGQNASCLVFNRELCTSSQQATPIRLSIFRGNAPLGAGTSSGIKAYAWLQRGNNVCSTDSALTQDGNLVWPYNLGHNTGVARTNSLPSSYAVVSSSGSQALGLPDEFINGWPSDKRSNGVPVLTAGDIMHAFPDVCGTDEGIAYARMRLCFGIDFAGVGTINLGSVAATTTTTGAATNSTPTGFFEFLVSTAPPPAPESGAPQGLYERVRFDVTYDNSQQTLLQLRIDQIANPTAAQASDCGAWEDDVTEFGEPKDLGGQIGAGSLTIDVPGENGTPYAYCVYTIDVVGNISVPAGPFLGSPEAQNGIFSIWDPPPRTGYGSCQQAPVVLPACGLAWGFLRLRRRRAQPSF